MVANDVIDVVADDETDDDALVEAVDVADDVPVDVTDEVTLLDADDVTELEADDVADVVADVVTEDVAVLDTELVAVDVCVVCSHSRNAPARYSSMAWFSNKIVSVHPFADPIRYPSNVHDTAASLALATLSPNLAAAAIVFSDAATLSQFDPFPPV